MLSYSLEYAWLEKDRETLDDARREIERLCDEVADDVARADVQKAGTMLSMASRMLEEQTCWLMGLHVSLQDHADTRMKEMLSDMWRGLSDTTQIHSELCPKVATVMRKRRVVPRQKVYVPSKKGS